MHIEMLSEYSASNHTLLIKFDANQQYSKEVEVSAYNANESISTNPFNDLPESKTLVLNRLPPWTDPDSVKDLMVRLSNGSAVRHVRIFKDKPLYTLIDHNNDDESIWPKPDRLGRLIRGFKQAHVIFEKVVGMKSAIQEITSNPNRIWLLSTAEQPVVNIGLRKWKREYNMAVIPNDEAKTRLQNAIEEYIRNHDRTKEEEKIKAKAMVESQEAGDDDGWITVSRHTSKKGKPLGNLSAKGQAKIKAKDVKRRKRKELMNFYKFQTREKKFDRLNELKERFEADKLKQAKMKQDRQDRKFRPV